MREELLFSVSDFVALVNQTLEYAYPNVVIQGEISNFKISKNRWVYFDIKDDGASVRCFMTVYQLHGVFEDGMMVRVRANPKLHEQYGFSLTIQTMQPAGEGAIKKAADLLRQKLELEGLFSQGRKRSVPFPPQRIALIASRESAAYGDFIKVLSARWGGIIIDSYDVRVQGELAPDNLVRAIALATQSSAEVMVVTRGGGSSDDLAAFDDERVVRAIAASRLPTIVAIGHERDESLAELVADLPASTPSNAAELLVPDRQEVLATLKQTGVRLNLVLQQNLQDKKSYLQTLSLQLQHSFALYMQTKQQVLTAQKQMLAALDPMAILARGFSVVSHNGKIVKSTHAVLPGSLLTITMIDGVIEAKTMTAHPDNNEKGI